MKHYRAPGRTKPGRQNSAIQTAKEKQFKTTRKSTPIVARVLLIATVLANMSRHRTSRIVIESDLNVSLAPSLEGMTGSRIHSNANGASSRWREAVTEWMHSIR